MVRSQTCARGSKCVKRIKPCWATEPSLTTYKGALTLHFDMWSTVEGKTDPAMIA